MIRVKVRNKDFKIVCKHLAEKRKIAAIKHLRNNSINLDAPSERLSLKIAKFAVESIASGEPCTEVQIVPEWRVHSLTVSGEDDTRIEVDIDTLQMHFLSSLSTLGLDEVGHLLELVDYIRDWQSRDYRDGTLEVTHNED